MSKILHRLAMELDVFRQQRLCAYNAGLRETCDCKYWRPDKERQSSEVTGCPEIRDIVAELLEYALLSPKTENR